MKPLYIVSVLVVPYAMLCVAAEAWIPKWDRLDTLAAIAGTLIAVIAAAIAHHK